MRRIKLLLLVFLTGIILTGCSSSKLSEAYDEELLKTDAREIVDMFCNEEYDNIFDKMSENMQDKISAEQLKEVWEPIYAKLGKFGSISKEGVVGKENLATVIEIAKFENGKVKFTITYNEEMKLEGLYIK